MSATSPNVLLGSPEKMRQDRAGTLRHAAFLGLCAMCTLGMFVAIRLVLLAPNEATMGFIQRIFYFHVPSAWVALMASIVSGLAGLIFLFLRSEKAEWVLVSSGHLVILFGACVLVTGPLWAKMAWGVFWQWDVRLTTTLLLWIVFVVAHVARSYAGEEGKRLAAGLAVFALVDVPLIYISVSWWRHQHPKTTVVRTLDPSMRPAFWASMITFSLLFVVLFVIRYRLEKQKAAYRQWMSHLALNTAHGKEVTK